MPSEALSILARDKASWRHKFRTPRKEKKKTQSWLASTPMFLRLEWKESRQEQHSADSDAGKKSAEGISLTYEIMRSMVSALSYIEQHGHGDLHHRQHPCLDHNPRVDSANDIEQCKRLDTTQQASRPSRHLQTIQRCKHHLPWIETRNTKL